MSIRGALPVCDLPQVQKPNDAVQREHCPDQKGESVGSHLGTPTATHPNPNALPACRFRTMSPMISAWKRLKSANARLSPVCRRDSAPRRAIAREFELHGHDAQRFRVPISHELRVLERPVPQHLGRSTRIAFTYERPCQSV